MSRNHTQADTRYLLEPEGLQALMDALRADGYTLVGPTLRGGAILYEEVRGLDDLPRGWRDEHEGGHYRLKPREDGAYFGYVVGPTSPKRYLFPPDFTLWRARRTEDGFEITEDEEEAPRYAFLGVRPCELSAMAVQDRVFSGGPYPDPAYGARRERALVVAVNCTEPGGTCFCASMGTGPRARDGFDLCLTEWIDGKRHAFAVEVGSARGAELLEELPHRALDEADAAEVDRRLSEAAGRMGRTMEVEGIQGLLTRNLEHPRWREVAERCLNCANCTLVCPTCFCHTVEDVTDLTGEEAERVRRWDSCFSVDFSYIHGGAVRTSAKARYRQWMTHKLATWFEQFGTSGCVGCGRCITWCPVGIDLTEEVRAIRESEGERP